MNKHDSFDIAVIGAGAAGLSFTSVGAQLGLNIALIESGKMGGDCLNYGCVPSKSLLSAAKQFYHATHSENLGVEAKKVSLNFTAVMKHVHDVIDKISEHDSVERFSALGATVFQEEAHFLDKYHLKVGDAVIKARHYVIATGSSPSVPPIPGLNEVTFYSNETLFKLKELPKKLIIIGGGPIGCEMAQAFAMMGSEVSLLEAAKILPKDSADCVEVVRDQMIKMNINILENIRIEKISGKRKIQIHYQSNAEPQELEGTHLLIATGRKPNVDALHLSSADVLHDEKGIKTNHYMQTSNKKIYAIGDITGPYQFTHMAEYQAGIAIKNILFKLPAKANYQAVPWVTYTYPELAHVGISHEEAGKISGVKTLEYPLKDNDRAQTENQTAGKIKISVTAKAKVLAVTIVSVNAGELILPWSMMIKEKKSLKKLTDCIVAYPTLSEINKRVASDFYRPVLFSSKVKKLVHFLKKLG